jgi:hypothetical protein
MKLKLPTVESLKQFNVRLPESLKAELTQLREECDADHLDFNAAVTTTLRTFALSLRAELSSRKGKAVASRSASENGADPLADSQKM